MFVIFGLAGAAAGALLWYQRLQNNPSGGATIMVMRRASGVLAAFVNGLSMLLDALMMVRRVNALSASSGPIRIGRSADEDD